MSSQNSGITWYQTR